VPKGHWELVLQQLRLSPEQKAALLAERSRMLVRLSDILVERQKLAQELAAAAVVPGDDYLQLTSAALQVGLTCCLVVGKLMPVAAANNRRCVF
jgi:hypothetical protein